MFGGKNSTDPIVQDLLAGTSETSACGAGGVSGTAEKNRPRYALVQWPWDLNNFYEWYNDWVNLVESLVVLQWPVENVEIFLAGVQDHEKLKQRPFLQAWALLFGNANVHVGMMGKELFGGREARCFREVAFVPFGGVSTISGNGGRAGKQTKCAAPTVMASALLLEGLAFSKEADAESIAGADHAPTLVRTAREVPPATAPATAPPAPSPRGDTTADKTDEQKPHRTLTLLLRNTSHRRWAPSDDAVVLAAALAVEKAKSSSRWSIRTLELSGLTLQQQLKAASTTDVLVGVVGAGMTIALFLPPGARIVEAYCEDRSSRNGHYRTIEAQAEQLASTVVSTGRNVSSPKHQQFHFSMDRSNGPCALDGKQITKAVQALEEAKGETSTAEKPVAFLQEPESLLEHRSKTPLMRSAGDQTGRMGVDADGSIRKDVP